MTRVLVAGVPRSGTTWVAQVLCAASGASYVEEPDNHFRFAFAHRAKRQLGRGPYPEILPHENAAATGFDALWRHAFSTDRRSTLQALSRSLSNRLVTLAGPRRAVDTLAGAPDDVRLRLAGRLATPEHATAPCSDVVVKSVYAPLCAEWVSLHHATGTVAVVRRPLEIVASWVTLGWLGPRWPDPLSSVPLSLVDALASRYGVPAPSSSRLARAAWLIGVFQRALEDAISRNPRWALVEHEQLYRSPLEEFPRLAAAVELPWTDAGNRVIAEGRHPGKGYDTRRVASQLDDAWRTRLDDRQVDEARAVLDRLPLDV